MLLNSIYELMDYNPRLINQDKVIADFAHKFSGSYCFIDGNLIPLEVITDGVIISGPNNYSFQNEHIIKPFLPKTGIYIYKDNAIYLHRKPAKQWTKSYCTGTYHQKLIKGTYLKVPQLLTAEYKEELAIHNGNVYFHWFYCGVVKTFTIYLNPEFSNFINEIQELCPQYKVSLASPTPRKSSKIKPQTLDQILDLKLN